MLRPNPTPAPNLVFAALIGVCGLSSFALGCAESREGGEVRARQWYDDPHPVPEGIPFTGEGAPSTSEPVEGPEECKRGRGIDGDGNCVVLFTEKLEFGGMVQIPAGTFLRGDIPVRYDARGGRERPHIQFAGQPLWQDSLPGYWIDGFEISRGAYEKCVAEGGCSEPRCLDGSDGTPTEREISPEELLAFPQTCVTHEQAEAYCEWRGARLPTEGEWEYAARGPQGWIFPWGYELRDELGVALGPVGYDPLDISYFGLKGFGGNAIEWVGDAYEVDANLSHYLAGKFRSEKGPLARSWKAWVEQLCGGSSCELGTRYVVKGGRTGAQATAWQLAEGAELSEIPEGNFNEDRTFAQHPRLGFRCAKDVDPDQPTLTVPEGPAPLPLLRQDNSYELFMALAESVDHEEAKRFCSQLVAPGDAPEGDNGWRLPTLDEVHAVVRWFGGPGPFWLAEGAAEQVQVDTEGAQWEMVEAGEDEALMARCIRDR